jgi:hypothetical protein
MVVAGLYMLTETYMKGLGLMTKRKAQELTPTWMELDIRVIGKRISSMVMVRRLGLMVLAMKEITREVKNTVKGSSSGQMAQPTMVIFSIITFMVMVPTTGPMVESSRETGETIRCMALEFSSGQTADDTKGSTSTIKNKDTESLSGKQLLLSYFTIKYRPDGRKYIGNWIGGK